MVRVSKYQWQWTRPRKYAESYARELNLSDQIGLAPHSVHPQFPSLIQYASSGHGYVAGRPESYARELIFGTPIDRGAQVGTRSDLTGLESRLRLAAQMLFSIWPKPGRPV